MLWYTALDNGTNTQEGVDIKPMPPIPRIGFFEIMEKSLAIATKKNITPKVRIVFLYFNY